MTDKDFVGSCRIFIYSVRITFCVSGNDYDYHNHNINLMIIEGISIGQKKFCVSIKYFAKLQIIYLNFKDIEHLSEVVLNYVSMKNIKRGREVSRSARNYGELYEHSLH